MSKRIKLPDGKYCYVGVGCKLHSPTGVQAAKKKLEEAQRIYLTVGSLEDLESQRKALDEAKLAYDATPEGQQKLLKSIEATTNDKIEEYQLKIRLRDAQLYADTVEKEAEQLAEEDELELKPIRLKEADPSYEKKFEPEVTVNGGYMGTDSWVGPLRDQKSYVPVGEIIPKLRATVKEAQENGYLPSNLKYSITKSYGGGIDFVVRGVADSSQYDANNLDRWGEPSISDEAKELTRRMSLLADAYNYDASNSSVDYYNRGFYCHPKIETESGKSYREREASLKKDRAEGLKREKVFTADYNANKEQALSTIFWDKLPAGNNNGEVEVGNIPGTKLYFVQIPDVATQYKTKATYLINVSGRDTESDLATKQAIASTWFRRAGGRSRGFSWTRKNAKRLA